MNYFNSSPLATSQNRSIRKEDSEDSRVYFDKATSGYRLSKFKVYDTHSMQYTVW